MKRTEPGMSPFWDYIGMQELEMGDEYARLQIGLAPELRNRNGEVPRGVMSILLDSAIGSAVRSTLEEEQSSATVELHIHFFEPATGPYLIAKSSLSHRGHTLAVGQAEVFDATGSLAAAATGTFIIFHPHK